jgi:hypothetical protein
VITTPVVIDAPVAVATSPTPPIATPPVSRPRPHKRKLASRAQVVFDEPFGDVIVVRPEAVQAPLFTVKEYKERGVLVH